jgi:hypothetical protein
MDGSFGFGLLQISLEEEKMFVTLLLLVLPLSHFARISVLGHLHGAEAPVECRWRAEQDQFVGVPPSTVDPPARRREAARFPLPGSAPRGRPAPSSRPVHFSVLTWDHLHGAAARFVQMVS